MLVLTRGQVSSLASLSLKHKRAEGWLGPLCIKVEHDLESHYDYSIFLLWMQSNLLFVYGLYPWGTIGGFLIFRGQHFLYHQDSAADA